jgi:FKBP-type peptidyl-prolyl cis-trans isomerase FklB
MTPDEAQQFLQAFQVKLRQEMEEKRQAEIKENKTKGADFMAENAKKEGVVTLPSGLQYKVLKEGTGKIPADSSTVTMHYEGRLINDSVFDSSYKRNQPYTVRCNQNIKGFTEALTHMPAGSVWEVYIPQELAYGERQAGQMVKPFSALVFKIELIEVK